MSKNRSNTDQVQRALEDRFDDESWLRLLEPFRHTGVADRGQVELATGLSRDQFNTRLAHFQQLAGKEILAQVPFSVPRPGQRGKPSALFKLGPVGAALLRANGHPKASPCGLEDATPLAHAQAVLDVRLAAEAAGLKVRTERELLYTAPDGQRTALRPDNVVDSPGGVRLIFEVEQAARLVLLRRARESLEHKAAFYLSPAWQGVSPTVRVLVNLPLGPAWEGTVRVWEQASAIVAEEGGGELPFKIVAMPLLDFLAEPDWGEPPDEGRWESLFDPAQVSSFGSQPVSKEEEPSDKAAATKTRRKRLPQVPAVWRSRSPAGDLLVLEAFWQHFCQHAPQLAGDEDMPAPPSPVFFELMQLIYVASHDPQASPWEQATFPFASVYLLQRYLKLHPKLRLALGKAVARGNSRINWSTPTISQKMQVVFQCFFHYHGFRLGRLLQAYPIPPWKRRGSFADFGVGVRIDPELLLGGGDGVVPSQAEVRAVEEALAWVLWALFAHCQRLLSKTPPFW